MADLPSTFNKINDIEVDQDAPVTENILTRLGQNDNYLKDALDSEISSRVASDSSLNSQISTIEVQVNQIVNTPVLLAQGSVTIGVPANSFQYVSQFFLYKAYGGTPTTRLRIQIFDDDGDDMAWDADHDLSIDPDTWDTSATHYVFQGDPTTVHWRLFRYVTVSV